ncbi:hypothetical protein DM01DRAFT_1337141 [Hesseltinella vesiculosa]|uniref:Nop52-domain-containing protein n=1 Tax=Hesseltinella vesiculosa TaxID=101127 RepID=A0A1X2GE03_9FUNG|nr:hypothetical protein DM01DRAFT_1337141 [Hesseltinella vesiculosa]
MGLFYCFWMSDKPLVQQQLANELGSLQLLLQDDNVIPFVSMFWKIHCAEWYGLDRIRTDKYLLLFRRQIFYSFAWLATHQWDQEKIEAYTTCLLQGPLHPTDRSKPDGIKFHILDIYLDELNKVIEQQQEGMDDDDELAVPMGQLLRPIHVLCTDDVNKITRRRCKQIIKNYEQEMEQEDEEDEDEE